MVFDRITSQKQGAGLFDAIPASLDLASSDLRRRAFAWWPMRGCSSRPRRSPSIASVCKSSPTAGVDLGDAPGTGERRSRTSCWTLVASALAGGDASTAAALRASEAAPRRVHGCTVKAPSSSGTCLAASAGATTSASSSRSAASARPRLGRPGRDPATRRDRPRWRRSREGDLRTWRRRAPATTGYTGVRGYHPLLAVAAGHGSDARLREGRANTARGAARWYFPSETVGRVRARRTSEQPVRADSGLLHPRRRRRLPQADVRLLHHDSPAAYEPTHADRGDRRKRTGRRSAYWLPGGAPCSPTTTYERRSSTSRGSSARAAHRCGASSRADRPGSLARALHQLQLRVAFAPRVVVGRGGRPSPTARAIEIGAFERTASGFNHPPDRYGGAGRAFEESRCRSSAQNLARCSTGSGTSRDPDHRDGPVTLPGGTLPSLSPAGGGAVSWHHALVVAWFKTDHWSTDSGPQSAGLIA